MAELMIIADDFTGALDTAVHFAEQGIKTRVLVSLENDNSWQDGLRLADTTVLVVDTETRHLTSRQAYNKVFAVVSKGKQAGIPYIYKKTDSALRGNIGSELEAAYQAAGEQVLGFIPAFPQMNRYTKGGKQYIDGVPVSKSVFGKDPFEPVTEDSVKEIIHLQSDISVTDAACPAYPISQSRGIVVYDAQTEADMEHIANHLAVSGQFALLAGCAGFAARLPELLHLQKGETRKPMPGNKLFVICGSVNPITRSQLAYGEKAGYPRVLIGTGEKFDLAFWSSDQGVRMMEKLIRESEGNDCVILDSNDKVGQQDTLSYARELGLDARQAGQMISQTLGMILKNMLDLGLQAVILVTGGDTLLGFMKQISRWELEPIRQIRPGCVHTRLSYHGREYDIITKSGGFGTENLLTELTKDLSGR